MKLAAKIISTLLNPISLLLPLPFLLVFRATGDFDYSVYWFLVSLIFLGLFSIFILIGVWKGYFSDLDISRRNQRPLLYLAAILMSTIYLVLLFVTNAPLILAIGVIGLLLGLAVTDLVNMKTKASVHVATITGFVTVMTLLYGLQFSFLYVLVPIVAWARIKTKNHTLSQTVLGATLSFILTIFVYMVFMYIINK
jgi:membrane-associated phospholipid phosphatase